MITKRHFLFLRDGLVFLAIAGLFMPVDIFAQHPSSEEDAHGAETTTTMSAANASHISYGSALTPTTFKSIKLTPKDRNPFDEKRVGEPTTGERKPDGSEAPRLFQRMRVSGISGSQGNYSIQVGPLKLREGDKVPQLFVDQTEDIVVKTITSEEVVFQFVRVDGSSEEREFSMRIDLAPRVRALMLGEAMTKLGLTGEIMPPMASASGDAFMQGAKDQELQSFVDRSIEMLGVQGMKRANEEELPESSNE